jgi:hypothetical protein
VPLCNRAPLVAIVRQPANPVSDRPAGVRVASRTVACDPPGGLLPRKRGVPSHAIYLCLASFNFVAAVFDIGLSPSPLLLGRLLVVLLAMRFVLRLLAGR